MQTNPPEAAPDSKSLPARIGWLILILTTLYVCYFSHLGVIGFVGPDEPRYAWIARAMAETGDWVTPRLYGKPWFEKPPLYYWGAALSFKLFGVSEAAARLPSAVSALLATFALAWLALRLYGAETARWLLLLLPTTVGMIGFSHAAATDMPFSAMLTIAMAAAAVLLRLVPPRESASTAATESTPDSPSSSGADSTYSTHLAAVVFGFFLGLAVLAKGPAGIILCGGAVFFWALITKRWRDALRLLHLAGITAFCVTALPWYILCARRNPDFLRIFIFEHNFKRFLTPEFQHVQPWWYYSLILIIAFIPWTSFLSWSAFFGTARLFLHRSLSLDPISPATSYFLLWALFCLVFFSASQSKLPGYILPAIHPIGLLLARSYSSLVVDRPHRFRFSQLSIGFFLCGLCLVSEVVEWRISSASPAVVAAGILVGLIGITNVAFGGFDLTAEPTTFRRLAPALSVVPILFALVFIDNFLSSIFRCDPSGRTIARELQFRQIPSASLLVSGMNRGLRYSLSFYLHDEIKEWTSDHPAEGFLLRSRRGCKDLAPTSDCEELSFDSQSTGRFLYRLTADNSFSSGASRRQPQ